MEMVYDEVCRHIINGNPGLLWNPRRRSNNPHVKFHENGDLYQFGVFAGRSLRDLVRIFQPTPYLHAVWGFDTFTGMPDSSHDNVTLTKEWATGRFTIGGPSRIPRVLRYVTRDNTTTLPIDFVVGEYQHSLTPTLVRERGMAAASYIDIDCDTYTSSLVALDWMFAQRLVVPGTVIGYDDFWVLACAFADPCGAAARPALLLLAERC